MTVSTGRHQQREATRQRILEAAIRLFALRGFDGTSLGDIAREADVKKALVQYHFQAKETLWRTCADTLWARRNQQLSEYQTLETAADRQQLLRQILGQISALTLHEPQWLQLLFNEAANPGPRLDWLVKQHVQQDFAQGLQFVEMAQRDQLLPAGHPLDLLLLLSGSLTYLFLVAPVTQHVTGEDYTSPATIQRYLTTLQQLVSPGQPGPE